MLCPVAKLCHVPIKRLSQLASLVSWRRLIECRDRQRRVVMIVKQLNATDARPQQCLCSFDHRDDLLVVARKEFYLEFQNPMPTGHSRPARLCRKMALVGHLVEVRVIEAGELDSLSLHAPNELLLA